ncbi:MAG: GNAT family N-acetyltransferase [Candidatus Rokubacteria bacterium]|nr:GNAT family N-acetyltransferase [Candidatus Rokubacteria bacterium]
MIECRTYEGGAAELARFIQDVWRGSYAGRMPVPLWDERYFDWQLLSERPGGRDYLLVAYDGTRLVGSLLAEGFRFRLHDREVDGSMASWMAVDADYRRKGIGTMLYQEQRRRHVERGAAFSLAFVYLQPGVSLGPVFSSSVAGDTVILGKVGWWARVLDHRAVVGWDVSRRNRLGVSILRALHSGPPLAVGLDGIRGYRPADLPACLALVHGLLARVDLGCVWSPERLAHQLRYEDVPRTLVVEQDGRVGGLVNYYRLDLLGRHPIGAGVIDLLAFGSLPNTTRQRLLLAALAQMREEGMKFALLLRWPAWPSRPLWATGFVPMPRNLSPICFVMDRTVSLARVKRLQVHFR